MAVLFSQIKGDMKYFRDTSKVANDVQVLGLRIEGWVGTKNLLFRAIMKGKSASSYITMIMFNGIEFVEKKDKDHTLPVAIDGKMYYAQVPDLWKNTIRFKDTCPDFRFRFEKELYDVGAMIGNWRRYTKVPGSTRGPVNPDNRLGYCKHIFSLLTQLKRMGYIKE